MKILRNTLLALSTIVGFLCPQQMNGQALADTISIFGPGACGGNVSANFVVGAAAGAGTGLQAVGTAFTAVYQVASSAAATDIISCAVPTMSRTTSGKGITAVAGVAFFYGIVTTTATSENAPTCISFAPPVPATGETASAAAGTSITLTSIPVVGSANLTAVTTGQFNTTYLAFTTPPAMNGPYTGISCSFSFGQTAGSAMQVNTPGGIVFTTNTITWLKRHKYEASVRGLQQLGIPTETSNLIAAHYKPRSPKAIEYMATYRQRQDNKVLAALRDRISNGPILSASF